MQNDDPTQVDTDQSPNGGDAQPPAASEAAIAPQPETTTAPAAERAEPPGRKKRAAEKKAKADQPAPELPAGYVPRHVRMVGALDYSRARPRQKPVEVVRAWPGVKNGQLVVLHPAHQKRLLRGGFVKEV